MPEETNTQTISDNFHTSRPIQESRIDFLLEEEFSCDQEFVRHFVEACGSALVPGAVELAVRSVSDEFGEADLVVLMSAVNTTGGEVRLALLIEDKITAPPQPDQSKRYQQRGEYGCETDLWDEFLTVLVAPSTYIGSAHGYDAAITLEQIKEWICLTDPVRRDYKIRVIDEAIAKKNMTGVQIVDSDMTVFRKEYYAALQEFNSSHQTDFRMRPPQNTYWGDYWFYLKSSSLPANALIRHVPRYGKAPYTAIIELIFKNTPLEKLTGIQRLLDTDMSLVATGTRGQNVAIRLQGETVAVFNDFERDKDKVLEAFRSATRLVQFYQDNHAQIDAMLASAT